MKRNLLRVDFGLLIPACLLGFFSLATLFSIDVGLFRSQLTFFFISLLAFFFFSQIHNHALELYAIPVYVISLLLLGILFFIGFESRGAVRWVELFGVSIQFSEILKPFLAISLSAFLAHRTTSVKTFFLLGMLLAPITFLIYLQPDLGNALVYVGTVFFVILVFGFPWWWFVAGGLIFGVSLPFIWGFLHDYQKQRILTFINPTHDPLGISYNVIQSIIAVGSGMFFGKGFQEATQSGLRFLPERHTDFIFATFTESFGFSGTVILLITFFILLYRIFQIYQHCDSYFPKLYASACFFLIIIQFFVNIGMNIGILPIVGITLPFVSYGGSSLLSNFILLGLLSSVHSVSKRQAVLEIR